VLVELKTLSGIRSLKNFTSTHHSQKAVGGGHLPKGGNTLKDIQALEYRKQDIKHRRKKRKVERKS
jgi:hypothetical protein